MNDKYKSIIQFLLSVLTIFIIIDIISLVLIPILPFSESTLNTTFQLDFLISIILIITIIGNKIILKEHNKIHFIILIFLFPFGLIFSYIGGFSYSILYIFYYFHLIALLYGIKVLGTKLFKFSKENNLGYGIIFILILFTICALIFFLNEKGINPNVYYFDDALWYSVTSITSTGYGDIVPVTRIGRYMGIILMVSGLAFASFATASVASSLISRFKKEKKEGKENLLELYKTLENNQKETQKELKEIKELLKELNKEE